MRNPEIKAIDDWIELLKQQKRDIQSNCVHPKETLKKEYKSNTGNYDPLCDCYWIAFHCDVCDKYWSEDQ